MQIKFRIFDLLLLTAFIAVMAVLYRTDLVTFSLLLFYSFASAGAVAGCCYLPRFNWHVSVAGFVGGFIGGIGVLIAATSISAATPGVTGPFPELKHISFPAFVFLAMPATLFSAILGCASGPFLAGYFKSGPTARDPETERKKRFASWMILLGFWLLTFFSLLERLHFGSYRDWDSISPLLMFFYLVYTIDWTSRQYSRKRTFETTIESESKD